MKLGAFASERLMKSFVDLSYENGAVTYDKRNLPLSVVGYDFHPTCCVFSCSSANLTFTNHKLCKIILLWSNDRSEVIVSKCQGH